MPRQPMPHVIVLLPGITGSVLQKDGRDIWALSGGAVLRGLLHLGGNFNDLALSEDPPDEDDLGDGVTAPSLIPDTHLVPGLWKIDGYTKVADVIQQEFKVEEGENFFTFPYDWRRDNRVGARRLARQAHKWLADWKTESGNQDAELVLVAHSMGGIVARYFLEVLEGWKKTKALITFGTPYRGSLNALRFLVEGFKKGPFGLFDLTRAMRSFTSVYQLLPTYRVYDQGDGEFVRVGETDGIPNVDFEKSADALSFHREIEAAVDQNRADDDYVNNGYSIFPVVGIRQPTVQSARKAGDEIHFLRELGGQNLKGDGTVPRVSATPLELSQEHREMFAATMHGSLQNADAVLANLHGILSGLDLNLGDFFAPPLRQIPLSLSMEDIYLSNESFEVRVDPGVEGVRLHTEIRNLETDEVLVTAEPQPSGDGTQSVTVFPLPAGAYRIAVTGDEKVEPVTDVFVVFDPASLDRVE